MYSSNIHFENMIQLSLHGVYLNKYTSLEELTKTVLSIQDIHTICVLCNKTNKEVLHGDFIWVYESYFNRVTRDDIFYFTNKYKLINSDSFYISDTLDNKNLNTDICIKNNLDDVNDDRSILVININGAICDIFTIKNDLLNYYSISRVNLNKCLLNPLKYRVGNNTFIYKSDYIKLKSSICYSKLKYLTPLKLLSKYNSPIVKLTKQGVFVCEYNCADDIIATHDITRNKLYKAIRSLSYSSNFYWIDASNYYRNIQRFPSYYKKINPNFTSLIQCDLDGKFLNEFNSLDDLCNSLNLDSKYVINCLKKKAIIQNSFRIYRYEDFYYEIHSKKL